MIAVYIGLGILGLVVFYLLFRLGSKAVLKSYKEFKSNEEGRHGNQ